MRSGRGFTLNELLVAMAVMALFLGVAYAALLPVITYLSPAQAKINTQQNAVPLLYKLQREVRQSDYRSIFVGTGASPPPATLTSETTLAVATAKSGTNGGACYPGGDFITVPGSGQPYWQGFDVFMLQNAALKCVYETLTGGQQTTFPTSAQAAAAITAASGVANPAVFGNAVLDIKIAADPTAFVTDFQVKAVSTVHGVSNATTYTVDILTRN